jgi:chemotaxis protein histidine kinase CheA
LSGNEPDTEQFAAIPADDEPEPSSEESATEQFPAVSAEVAKAPAAPEAAAPEAAAPEPVAPEPAAPAPQPAPQAQGVQGHVRVDARLLEAALLNLRKRIAAIPLVFQIAGSEEVKTERG